VLDGKVIFPVVGQALVEGAVFLSSDVRGVASPNRLRLVELLVGGLSLLDLLGLLLLLLIFIDFLNLSVFALLDFLLIILNLLKMKSETRPTKKK